MIGLLAILSIIGLVLCIVIYYFAGNDGEICFSFGIVSIVGILVFGVWSGVLFYKINIAFTISQEIEMYQQENTRIESEIDAIVKSYMEYEQNTFSDLRGESSLTLVTIFPELKSNELVQQQLRIYIHNNVTIKELRIKEIRIQKCVWLLYFGK